MPDPDQLERQLERLRIERERLGAVNLRAEEESQELSARLEAIISEREDVIEAIKKLRQAIQSLNREGRERLLAAFDVVNAQFQRLFTHLLVVVLRNCSSLRAMIHWMQGWKFWHAHPARSRRP